MLMEQVKENLTKAMKACSMAKPFPSSFHKIFVEMNILRVLLSNFQNQEAAQGKSLTEHQEINIVKKLINQNEEEIVTRTGHEQYAEIIEKLKMEIFILETYLPAFLSIDQITSILSNKIAVIKAAKNVSAATGVAIKLLKEHGNVEGQTVKDVVEKLYSA